VRFFNFFENPAQPFATRRGARPFANDARF
jgi:hypothetical protein